jgi:hypothetical protein
MTKKLIGIILIYLFWSCSDKNKPDKIIYDCLLDKVTSKDTLYLTNEYEGCFGGDKKIIKIYNQRDSMFASYLWRQYDTTILLKAPLNDSSIAIFQKFEKQGRNFKNIIGLCTSTYTYEAKINADKFTFIDKDCYFDLYERFLKRTFVFPKFDD